MSKYSPHVISKNPSVDQMRIQKEIKKGDAARYPIGRFLFKSIVNFGSRTPNCYEKVALVESTQGVILNHPDIIKNASDKVRCKELLVRHGVPTPKWQTLNEVKISYAVNKSTGKVAGRNVVGLTLNFPIVAKLRVGSGGEGMHVVHNKTELCEWHSGLQEEEQKKYFLEEVYQPNLKKNYEYRVSVSPLLEAKLMVYKDKFQTRLGEIIILRKFMGKEGVENESFGRNLKLGNSFFSRKVPRTFQRNKKIVSMDAAASIANEACRACGLDFGAVDMIYDSEAGEWTVLEINTAPSMGREDHTFTLERWKQAVGVMLQEKKDLI